MSIDEVKQYFDGVEARLAAATPYVVSRGAEQGLFNTVNGEAAGSWSLRSPEIQNFTDYYSISSNGFIVCLNAANRGLRPVIRIEYPD